MYFFSCVVSCDIATWKYTLENHLCRDTNETYMPNSVGNQKCKSSLLIVRFSKLVLLLCRHVYWTNKQLQCVYSSSHAYVQYARQNVFYLFIMQSLFLWITNINETKFAFPYFDLTIIVYLFKTVKIILQITCICPIIRRGHCLL